MLPPPSDPSLGCLDLINKTDFIQCSIDAYIFFWYLSICVLQAKKVNEKILFCIVWVWRRSDSMKSTDVKYTSEYTWACERLFMIVNSKDLVLLLLIISLENQLFSCCYLLILRSSLSKFYSILLYSILLYCLTIHSIGLMFKQNTCQFNDWWLWKHLCSKKHTLSK